MKTKWGGCNRRAGNIRLNTELVKKPKDLLEYVVVHEVLHLIEPTHSEHFMALQSKYYPTWREGAGRAQRPASFGGGLACDWGEPRGGLERVAPRIVRVGYPFDSGSHKMLWSRESIYQEANPEVTALARRGAA